MSRAFSFKLDSILDLRTRTEDERAQDLANARRKEHALRKEREELEQKRRDKILQLGGATNDGERVGQIQNLRFVLDHLEDRIRTAHAAEREAAAVVVDTRDAYTTAVRERMSLDRLKDRRKEAWSADQRRTEQNQMDEIATTRHEAARREMREDGR